MLLESFSISRSLINLFLRFVILPFIFFSCVNSTEQPPPDQLAPNIIINKPANNDTIYIGSNEIDYEVSDDVSTIFFDTYINDQNHERYLVDPGGKKTSILLNVDSTFKDSIISYYVMAYDEAGNGGMSNVMSDIYVTKRVFLPLEPTNLQLNTLTEYLNNLAWEDNSNNELNFEIWRKEGDNPFIFIRSLPPNTISANDTLPELLIDYSYKIRAVNEAGYTESNIVKSIPDLDEYIAAPSELEARASGTTNITLNWRDNSDNELIFKIERKVSSGNVYSQIAVVGPDITEYEDRDGLFPSTEFTYRIAAQGQFITSEWSNEASVATRSQNINAPTDLIATYEPNRFRIILNWNDNSLFETETIIERKVGPDGTYIEIARTGTNIASYIDTSIILGNLYYYRVRIFTTNGYFSDYSNEIFVNTQP